MSGDIPRFQIFCRLCDGKAVSPEVESAHGRKATVACLVCGVEDGLEAVHEDARRSANEHVQNDWEMLFRESPFKFERQKQAAQPSTHFYIRL